MKALKTALVGTSLSATVLLTACDVGGHGFEGQYSVEPTASYEAKLKMFEKSDVTRVAAQQARANLAAIDAEIGTDYAMFNGNRIKAERIFVREQEGKKYLVVDNVEGVDDVFPILDEEKKVLQVDADTKLVWEEGL